MAEAKELSTGDCERLLRSGVAGRVAVCTPDGPQIVPVNYSVIEQSVVFRTSPYSVVGTYAREAKLAFEVDYFDYDTHEGWSVVARGRADPVLDPDELASIRAEWPPRPWAAGARNLHFRLRWNELTGRQLGAGSPVTPVSRVVSFE